MRGVLRHARIATAPRGTTPDADYTKESCANDARDWPGAPAQADPAPRSITQTHLLSLPREDAIRFAKFLAFFWHFLRRLRPRVCSSVSATPHNNRRTSQQHLLTYYDLIHLALTQPNLTLPYPTN